MALVPCTDLSAADWLVDSELPWHQLVGFGPEGFAAYCRLRFLPDPTFAGQEEADVDNEGLPSDGERLRLVLRTLARHTRTPQDWFFCLWDGWSDPPEPRGPLVVVPYREYFLFRGSLADWDATGIWHEPAFVWPADRAWCVARDVDPHWAGIGATREAVGELLADARVDVVPADPGAVQPFYG